MIWNLDVIGRNMDVVKEKFVALEKGGSNFGLKVNDAKTKCMVVSSNGIVGKIRMLGNRCYFGLLNLLRSKAIHRNLKCMLYKTLIRIRLGVVVHDKQGRTNTFDIRKED